MVSDIEKRISKYFKSVARYSLWEYSPRCRYLVFTPRRVAHISVYQGIRNVHLWDQVV